MKTALYPTIAIQRITNPNRFYAFPILGFLVKLFMIIPQGIEMLILFFLIFIVVFLINPFVVLITGKYWDVAYELAVGFMKLSLKTSFFFSGLTNTYPGFDFTIHDSFSLEIPKPTTSSRFFAIPLLGYIVRVVLLIPYMIYTSILGYAAGLSMIGASFPVLFKGYYPETSFELLRDTQRLSIAHYMYFLGLSDTYPSFWISMNHKTMKWILIILSALYFVLNYSQTIMDINSSREKNAMMMEEKMRKDVNYQNMMRQNEMNGISNPQKMIENGGPDETK